jgi:hypothetical protein
MEGDDPLLREQEKHMSMNENELSLDDLEKVSGCFRMPVICPRPPRIPVSGRNGASGTSGDGDTQLGSDGGGPADGGSGGYMGDGNYLSAF